MGALRPNRVSVNAVITLVGMPTKWSAAKLMYLFPEIVAELMMVPLNTNVAQKKHADIRHSRNIIVFERIKRKM